MNLFELVSSARTLPNDKNHRIGICRRLRHVVHIPTGIMLADQLTKRMTSALFMKFLSTGVWSTKLNGELRARIKRAAKKGQVVYGTRF